MVIQLINNQLFMINVFFKKLHITLHKIFLN